jgi:alcohol dehydrogenase class IV
MANEQSSGIHQHWNPGKIIFGPGSLSRLPQELGRGETPLLVTDPGLVRAGILGKLTGLLERAGMAYACFDQALPDPPVPVVDRAARVYRHSRCTVLVALGGGSSIDVAKATAIRVSHQGPLQVYAQGRPLEESVPAIFAIPTTAGTGSEVTASSIITDPGQRKKMVLRDPRLVPRVALLDPMLLSSLPPRVAAETGTDALAHAVESYVSQNSQILSETLSLRSVQLIGSSLAQVVSHPEEEKAAGEMLWASCLAGMAFTNAGVGLVHALAHAVGARVSAAHGLLCALFLPHVIEFNFASCPGKYRQIGAALQGTTAVGREEAEPAKFIRSLLKKIGLPRTYAEAGISLRVDDEMLDEVKNTLAWKLNPRRADREELRRLCEAPQAEKGPLPDLGAG